MALIPLTAVPVAVLEALVARNDMITEMISMPLSIRVTLFG